MSSDIKNFVTFFKLHTEQADKAEAEAKHVAEERANRDVTLKRLHDLCQ